MDLHHDIRRGLRMSTTTLDESLALLRRRLVRRRRLNAGLAMFTMLGLSLVGWAALWAATTSFASLLAR
jgi:hypothetical protein